MAYHLNDGSEFNASGGTFYVIGRDLNQRCVHVDGNPGAYDSRTVVNIGYPDLGSPPFDLDPTHPPQQSSIESLRRGPPTPRRGAGTGSYSGRRMEPYHLNPEGRSESVQRPPGQSTRIAALTPRPCPETPRHMDHLPYARPSQQVLGAYHGARHGSVPSPQRAHATESISPPAPAQQSELGNLSGPHFATSDPGVEAPNLFEPTPIRDDLETKESSLYGQKTLETLTQMLKLLKSWEEDTTLFSEKAPSDPNPKSAHNATVPIHPPTPAQQSVSGYRFRLSEPLYVGRFRDWLAPSVPEPAAEDLGTGESSMHRHHFQTRTAYFRAATRKYLRATEEYINILRESSGEVPTAFDQVMPTRAIPSERLDWPVVYHRF